MPAFEHLTPEQIDALVAYLTELGRSEATREPARRRGRTSPAASGTPGETARGANVVA